PAPAPAPGARGREAPPHARREQAHEPRAITARARRPRPPAWVTRTTAALVALAVLLRVWHIRQGLPDFIEEAIPFKRAFEMWGWSTGHADLDPHLFHYPSFTFYLHFVLQKLHYAVGSLLGWFHARGDYFL